MGEKGARKVEDRSVRGGGAVEGGWILMLRGFGVRGIQDVCGTWVLFAAMVAVEGILGSP